MKLLAMQCFGAILAAAVMLGALTAQQRRPLAGTVVDAAGKPATNAQVTLVWSPPGGADCGDTDVVVVPTDGRGRFIARLLPQESYSAWAIASADETAQCSRVHENVAVGGDLQLALDRRPPQYPISLRNSEAWADAAPLRLEFSPIAANVSFWRARADGSMPPLPNLGRVLVRDASGQPLLFLPLAISDERPAFEVVLPHRRGLSLRIVDEKQAPLEGVEAWSVVGADPRPCTPEVWFDRTPYRALRLLGKTGTDGTATCTLPLSALGTNVVLRKPGFAEGSLSVDVRGKVRIGSAASSFTVSDRANITLSPAARLQFTANGKPVPVHKALLTAIYRLNTDQERAVALTCDQNGQCEVPLPPDPFESMLHVRSEPDGPWQLRRVPFASGKTTSIELTSQRRLLLQFLDENGGPAGGLAGMIVARGTNMASTQQIVVSTDQSGRIERTLGPDAWLLFVTDGLRWGRYEVPRYDDPRTVPEFRATIPCERFSPVRLKIVDQNGKAVAGARVASLLPNTKVNLDAVDENGLLAAAMTRIFANRRTGIDGLLDLACPESSAMRAFLQIPGVEPLTAVLLEPGRPCEVQVQMPAR